MTPTPHIPPEVEAKLRKACERLGLNMDNEDNQQFEAEILTLISEHSAEREQPEIEVLKRWRFKTIECPDCQTHDGWAGQAFTNYVCESCKINRSHPNTNTPKLCTSCAIYQFKCQRCEKSLDGQP